MIFHHKNVAKRFTQGTACINPVSFNVGIRIMMRDVNLIAVPFSPPLFVSLIIFTPQ